MKVNKGFLGALKSLAVLDSVRIQGSAILQARDDSESLNKGSALGRVVGGGMAK